MKEFTEEYAKAYMLTKRNFARKHPTYDRTKCLCINLAPNDPNKDDGSYWAYICPNEYCVNIVSHGEIVGYGTIDERTLTVTEYGVFGDTYRMK